MLIGDFAIHEIRDLYRLEFTHYEWYDFNKIEGNPTKIEISEYNYERIDNLCDGKDSVFPSTIQVGDITFFSFHERFKPKYWRDYFRDRFEIYLEWTMNNDAFNKEIERLSNIEFTINSKTREILYSENLFSYPSYINIYNDWAEFEYAIVDESTNTIRYIHFHEVGSKENLVFSEEFKPTKPLMNSDLKKVIGWTRFYSIYG